MALNYNVRNILLFFVGMCVDILKFQTNTIFIYILMNELCAVKSNVFVVLMAIYFDYFY